MLLSFNARKTLSRSVNADPDDVLKLKSTLFGLGHYKVPKWGITSYPDQDLFKGVEEFQKKNKLKVDGVLKPGGPTERSLDKILAKGFVQGEWDWMEKGATLGTKGDKAKAQPKMDILPSMLVSHAPEDEVTNYPRPKAKPDGTKVAFGPLTPAVIASGARIIAPHIPKLSREAQRLFGAAITAKKLEEVAKGKGGKTKETSRTVITIPTPPTPGLEPPEVPEHKSKEELIPEKIGDQKIPEPIPVPERPGIFIFPMPDAPLWDDIQERNETEKTKKEIDALRDHEAKKPDGWKHKYGGRDKKTGDDIKEYRVPGPGYAFPLSGRETGDGRKKSAYTDLTMVSPDGLSFRHYQHVDVDRNGKPTKRELDNAERIRRALNGKTNDQGIREHHDIILVPKKWQMKKGR